MITWDDFSKVELNIGTIIEAKPNEKARKPSYVLSIDFGDLGVKQSSAQITQNYQCEDLIGQQVVCVMNFEPKRVAGIKSEVLVLAGVCAHEGTVLLMPSKKVESGVAVS